MTVKRGILVVLAALALPALGTVHAGAAATVPNPPVGGIAAASIGLRLVDVPVSEIDDPSAQVYIIDHVAPGTVIQRRIQVVNSATNTTPVVLYPSAATIAKGSFLGSAGHTADELSTWMTVTPNAADIGARGSITATVTVDVPVDASPGERYGVVWAEARSPATSGTSITEVNRVGIRVYLSVGPGGPPASDFTITSLAGTRSAGGVPSVTAIVHNTGGRALDMSGSLELLSGPGGLTAGPFPATLGTTLAIGDTEPVTITLDSHVPDGPWDAHLTLHSGLIARTAQASLTFLRGIARPVKPISKRRAGWPLLALALGTALVLLIALVVAGRRRRRRSLGRHHPGRGKHRRHHHRGRTRSPTPAPTPSPTPV